MSQISQSNGIFSDNAFTQPSDGSTLTCPILIVGGSTAAYSATLAALNLGVEVYLVQPHKVVGGQFTAQALPASDDGDWLSKGNPAINLKGEEFAISKTQRWFRERQRQLQPVAGKVQRNPGGGWVSPLLTTPVVAATALNERLIPYLASGKLRLIPHCDPTEVLMTADSGSDPAAELPRVSGVRFHNHVTNSRFTITAQVTIEATDFGDLLELGNIDSRVGQELWSDTGEAILKVRDRAFPECQQSFTFNVLVEHTAPGRGQKVAAPDGYGRDTWLDPVEFTSDHWRLEERTPSKEGIWVKQPFFGSAGIFRYRRILRRSLSEPVVSTGDVAVINWGTSKDAKGVMKFCGNDFRLGSLIGSSREERQVLIQRARDRAQAYIHYLQTHGFPDLKPRGDLTWSADGIALDPYIREARRGVALTTIRHEDVAEIFFLNQSRARCFDDSLGIGDYHYLDLHGNLVDDFKKHVTPTGKAADALPFSLPAKSLVPMATDGLVLSAKSIGTTHITNAAYRMHPMEWAIGEASGYLAVFSVWTGESPRRVVKAQPLLRKLQGFMTRNGVPIFWFNDVTHDDDDFEAIQVMAATGVIRSESTSTLSFRPYANVSRAVVSTALVSFLDLEKISPARPSFSDVRPDYWAYSNIETLKAQGMISGVGRGRFAPDDMITRKQLSFLITAALPAAHAKAFENIPKDNQKLTRRELSRAFYAMLKFRLDI